MTLRIVGMAEGSLSTPCTAFVLDFLSNPYQLQLLQVRKLCKLYGSHQVPQECSK